MTTAPTTENPQDKPKPKGKPAKKASKPARAKIAKPKISFFPSDNITTDVLDGRIELARYKRICRVIWLQSLAVFMLSFLLLLGVPLFQPQYKYYTLSPKRDVTQLTPLIIPNVTQQAILSWATNSVTEIMTFGFGDYQAHLRQQYTRFTPDGWRKFAKLFDSMKIGEAFKLRQLVLTTVPSNSPLISHQGMNLEKHVYEWKIEVPVIMTYTTNDNVTRHQNTIIELTIRRVPTDLNPAGIAIDNWRSS